MRILGIDYGDSRIGVAISDPMGWIAQGLETISQKDGFNRALEKIAAICTEQKVETIVVGYPKNMNGTLGDRIDKTEGFIKSLTDKLANINVIRWDERLTSVSASKVLHETKNRNRDKGDIDKVSAVLILQGYLDSVK